MPVVQDTPPHLREHRTVALATPWRVHLIARQEHSSLVDRKYLNLVQNRQHVPLAIRPEEHRNAFIETAPTHRKLAANGLRLDRLTIQPVTLSTASVDDGKHETIILDGCTVLAWTAKLG